MVTLRLSPKSVFRFLVACAALLTIAGLTVVVMRFEFGHANVFGLSGRFNLNGEGNVPAYYSALQIAFAALLLAFIARAKRAAGDTYARHWMILCVIFAFLSLDEAAELHERLREPMLARFHLTGIWAYAWFIPYGILVAVFLGAYYRFFMHLPAAQRRLFAISSIAYVGATIGLETLQLYFVVTPAYGPAGELYAALSGSLEECVEMLGIAVFVYALLEYSTTHVRAVRLEFADRLATMSTPVPVEPPSAAGSAPQALQRLDVLP